MYLLWRRGSLVLDRNDRVSRQRTTAKTKLVETKTENFAITVILLKDSAETAVKK